MLVRMARTPDAPGVLRLHRSVLDEGRYFITMPHEFQVGVSDVVRLIREFDRSKNSLFLVAESAGDVAGFLTIRGGGLQRLRHTGKLEVMVSAEARGQGIGRALVEAAVQWACDHTELQKIGLAVFADNERAVKLYESLGFREEGRRVEEYLLEDGRLVDDILMYRYTRG